MLRLHSHTMKKAMAFIFALVLAGMYAPAPSATGANILDIGVVNSAIARGKRLAGKMKDAGIPANAYKAQGQAEARKAFEFYRSPAFQKAIARETQRLKRQVFKGIDAYYKNPPE